MTETPMGTKHKQPDHGRPRPCSPSWWHQKVRDLKIQQQRGSGQFQGAGVAEAQPFLLLPAPLARLKGVLVRAWFVHLG
jgi:hypothetical protein